MDKEAMTPESITLVFTFIIGAVVGSFLNVVIHRVPRRISIVSPPSSCGSCGERVRWYHNIPIVSYLLLAGRCASCSARFSIRYPVVELISAVAALTCVMTWGLGPLAIRTFAFIAILIALTYIDLEHWLLPHVLTWSGIVLGLATAWFPGAPGLVDGAIGAFAGVTAFWLLRLLASAAFKREALGGGDIWLLGMIGAFLGWKALLPVVFLASVQGSVIGLALILLRRGTHADELGTPTPDTPEADDDDDPDLDPSENRDQDQVSFQSMDDPAQEEPAETDLGEDIAAEEDAWTPPENAVPFGPFLALGALQLVFLEDVLFQVVYRFMGLD